MSKINYFLVSQFITLIGTELTRFAVPIWVFKSTGLNSNFALIALVGVLPKLLIGPYAGVIVDSYSPQKIILFSDFSQALGTFVILLSTYYFESPNIILLLVAFLIIGISMTFQYPAISKVIPKIAGKNELAKVNSYYSIIERSSEYIAPSIAGVLLFSTDIRNILIADVISYLIGSLILWFSLRNLKFEIDKSIKDLSFFNSILSGFKHIWNDRSLNLLLILSSVSNLCFSLSFVFITPFLLKLNVNEVYIGIIFSFGAAGQILGAFIVSRIKRPNNLIKVELIGTSAVGIFGFFIVGLFPHLYSITFSYLFMMITLTVLNVWNKTSWQSITPEKYQGRVFACRRSVTSLLGCIGLSFGGFFIDDILIPITDDYTLSYQVMFLLTGLLMIGTSIILSRFVSKTL